MPTRIENVRKMIILKRNKDKILQQNNSDIQTISNLKILLGENTLFTKPENKTNSQTLRHQVWKSRNSLVFLGKYIESYTSTLNKEILVEIEKYNIQIDKILKEFSKTSSTGSKLFKMLDELLIKEVSMLSKNNIAGYLNIVLEENKIIEAIDELSRSVENQLLYFEHQVKQINYPRLRKDTLGTILKAGVILSAITGFIFMFKNPAMSASIITLTIFLKETIERSVVSQDGKDLEKLFEGIMWA
jgi:hypothetical protein